MFCFFLSLCNNLFTSLPSCTCSVFRFSVSFLYLPLSISSNTTLLIYQDLCTCLSVAQMGYPPLGPIRNTATNSSSQGPLHGGRDTGPARQCNTYFRRYYKYKYCFVSIRLGCPLQACCIHQNHLKISCRFIWAEAYLK